MAKLSDEEFEGAIADALDSIPDQFVEAFQNVIVIAQDEPEDWQLEDGVDSYETQEGDMLGLFDGIGLSLQEDTGYGVNDYPEAIYIFKGPHERLGDNVEYVIEEVKKTVIHEVGHYFGMDEDQIDEMGYGDVGEEW